MTTSPLHLPAYRTLTFDCYGTLIDWESGLLRQLTDWRRRHRVQATDDELLEAFAAAESAIEEEQPRALYPDVLRAVHGRLAGCFGVASGPDEADTFARSVGDWPPFDDAPAALRTLAGRYRLVVLSNVDRRSFAESERQLGVRFDALVSAEDVGAYKPSPMFFERATERLRQVGVSTAELVHVAQSLFHDHLPARRLGWRTVWVDRRAGKTGWGATRPPEADVSPDLTVTSLAELVSIDERQRAFPGGSGGSIGP